MTRFSLVRLPNGDFVLSAGSRVPVDTTITAISIPDINANGVHASVIADLLLTASSGVTVQIA